MLRGADSHLIRGADGNGCVRQVPDGFILVFDGDARGHLFEAVV